MLESFTATPLQSFLADSSHFQLCRPIYSHTQPSPAISIPAISGHSQPFLALSSQLQSFQPFLPISSHPRNYRYIQRFQQFPAISSHFQIFPAISSNSKPISSQFQRFNNISSHFTPFQLSQVMSSPFKPFIKNHNHFQP